MCAMETRTTSTEPRLRCRVGTAVRVKPAAAIFTTLDADGRCEGLPFTAEMLAFCGGIFTVRTCLNRLYVEGDSVRGIHDVVVLENVRCDGNAHGACGRACHLLWKTAWLEPASLGAVAPFDSLSRITGPCQGVAAILREATTPLPWWQVGQYWDELRSGSRQIGELLALLGAGIGKLARWYGRKGLALLWRQRHAPSPNDIEPLGLHAGELVEVRSWPEIAATLDAGGKYRGMAFTQGMRRCCGRRAYVHTRVGSLIDEASGKQFRMTDTVLLEDLLCDGFLFRGCARACHWCWREAWLKRVPPSPPS
jgi:hypothetical protein